MPRSILLAATIAAASSLLCSGRALGQEGEPPGGPQALRFDTAETSSAAADLPEPPAEPRRSRRRSEPREDERESEPEPEPVSRPAAAAAIASDPDSVVRAAQGDWGMFFRFGGLATLLAGANSRNVGTLLVSQIGLKRAVSDHTMVPFYFGTGVRLISSGVGDDDTDVGFDVGVGVEYHFRIWRRISPFVGGSVGIAVSDASGRGGATWGVGLGPNLGVEYYIADRVSLTAQYLLTVQVAKGTIDPDSDRDLTAIQINTMSGGAMNLTFYF